MNGDEETVSQRLDELAAAGVDVYVEVIFDPSREVRERSVRCCERRTRGAQSGPGKELA